MALPFDMEYFEKAEYPYCNSAMAGGGRYEFYNVMWTEKSEEIYHRVAIGRVVKEIWERAATERVQITLS